MAEHALVNNKGRHTHVRKKGKRQNHNAARSTQHRAHKCISLPLLYLDLPSSPLLASVPSSLPLVRRQSYVGDNTCCVDSPLGSLVYSHSVGDLEVFLFGLLGDGGSTLIAWFITPFNDP